MTFLTLDEVIAIHSDQVGRYGGSMGIRDVGLLDSALAMPRASFDGKYLHETIHEMAAAHLYHIVQNHPFVDGNKRTGLMVTIAFLGLNGIALMADQDALCEMVLAVAAGQRSKSEVAVFLRDNTRASA